MALLTSDIGMWLLVWHFCQFPTAKKIKSSLFFGVFFFLNCDKIYIMKNIPGFPGGSMVKNPPANAGGAGSIFGLGRSLEKEIATCSSILAWRIPWTEESSSCNPESLQRVRISAAFGISVSQKLRSALQGAKFTGFLEALAYFAQHVAAGQSLYFVRGEPQGADSDVFQFNLDDAFGRALARCGLEFYFVGCLARCGASLSADDSWTFEGEVAFSWTDWAGVGDFSHLPFRLYRLGVFPLS